MTVAIVLIFGRNLFTDILRMGTASVETAALGRIHRARQLTRQQQPLLTALMGVSLGDSIQQKSGIRMQGLTVNRLRIADLAELAKEHDADAICNEAHN